MNPQARRRIFAESLLPPEVLARATLRGNEYAWPIDQIPLVVAAAERASLVNLGGQLQFRLTDGGTCECYWVDVHVDFNQLPGPSWAEKVTQSAKIALRSFERLRSSYDFLVEGRGNFQPVLDAEAKGEDLQAAMCFVWYVADADGRWQNGLEPN